MGLSYWQDDKRTILLWQVVANLIFAIHYTLLHARSGALCSFFQIVVLLLFLLQEKFNWSKLVTAIPIVAVFLLIDHHHGGVPVEEGIQKALNGQIPRHIAGGVCRRGAPRQA